MRLFHADAIVTADGPIIRDGAVVVRDDGVIEDVGDASAVIARATGLAATRVRGAIVPGLVNAHTHVELSSLHAKVRGGGGFVRWVDEMLGVRAEIEDDENAQAIARAVHHLDRAGTAAVGEVTNTLGAVQALADAGMAGAIFHEVFGVVRTSVLERASALAHDVAERFATWPSADLAYAPSPHTLYTTHPDAVRALVGQARSRGTRASLHLLEHADERRAIEQGDGPVAEWLGRRVPGAESVVWPKRPVLDVADSLGALASDVIVVHLTEAKRAELERMARVGSPVVSCPRSNLTIEGRLPPVPEMLAVGIAPALGTDSLASSPSLDVLEEARLLHEKLPELSAEVLLRMATWNGARVLGRDDLGRITKGARPGLVHFDLDLGDDVAASVIEAPVAARSWLARRRA